MLPGSKKNLNYKQQLLTIFIMVIALQVSAQQLVYDLRQEWVHFSSEDQGFLPLDEQNLANKVISFKLADPEFDHFYLSCAVTEKSYLFYGTKLFATIPAGVTNFKIDSLRRALGDSQPFITIYGNKLLPQLITQVRTQPLDPDKVSSFQRIRFANDFSNFFYFAATIIFLVFIVLKMKFYELADQYLLFQRAVKVKTIDELIYKIPYLGVPNFLFIIFMSLMLGFVTLSFTYFYPEEILFLEINAGVSSFGYLILNWLEISALILVLIVLKYLFSIALTSIFALDIASIHFASFLRLLFWFSFLLVFLILVQFFAIGWISLTIFLLILLFGVILMQIILFFKLSLVTTHTLLYIIVYLCATELIPILILFKILTS
jgi:Domain of unknown function (DUF4271)